MTFMTRMLKRFGYVKRHGGFAGALQNRLNADWLGGTGGPNAELFASLALLRARARELEKNNPLVRRYLNLVAENVIGHKGVRLQARTESSRNNQTIEGAYAEWGRPSNYSADGRLGCAALQQAVMRGIARDGEAFVRIVRVGPYGFSLQQIDPELVDEQYNRSVSDGLNAIKMGIEVDVWGRAVAFHVLDGHLHDVTGPRRTRTVRIPADEMLHLFIQRRPGQVRGESWLAPVMVLLHQGNGYADAEVMAARTAAAKMGFFVSKNSDEPVTIDPDAPQRTTMDAASGTIDYVDPGYEFQSWDPSHPSQNFALFMTQIGKFIASGLNVSFHALTSDLREVNFSSARIGLIQERDAWKVVQQWFIDGFCDPVYRQWRIHAWTTARLPLRMFPDNYNTHTWTPRGWEYTNPQQELQADMLAVAAGFKSPTQIILENGDDPEEELDGIAAFQKMADAKGVKLYIPNAVIDPDGNTNNDGSTDAGAGDRPGRDGDKDRRGHAHPRVALLRTAGQAVVRDGDTRTLA